ESEAGYRLLADAATDTIVMSALDRTREYVSPAWREVLGYDPHERGGTDPLEFVHPDDCLDYEGWTKALLAGGPPSTSVHRIRRGDDRCAGGVGAARRLSR